MKNIVVCILVTSSFLFSTEALLAQQVPKKSSNKKFLNNIFKRVLNSVTVSKKDSVVKAAVLNSKSELPYDYYDGKIIRKIRIKELGFEKVFTDTSKVIRYYGTRVLNYLHTDTYDWVIRDNLFIREGTRLNKYMVADNERYLRSLEFIQDARIIAKPIPKDKDSIDLEIVTKDLFSITGSAEWSSGHRQKITIAEKNLAGAGQKLQVTALRDKARYPVFGYNLLYTKNSVLHSFIDASLGYSRINPDRQGDEGVTSFYLQLDRPLFSPYSRFAGGLQVSFNSAKNNYIKPDSLFYNYQNNNFDVWGGYNIGVNDLVKDNKWRNRTFAALRVFNNNFKKIPDQIGDRFDPFYNSRSGVLGEVTLFRQEFYKTNYIYGFGTTEDVPYGYNIALTLGSYKQLQLERPYMGINANKYIITERGKFIQGFVRGGMFSSKGKMEDASVLVGGSLYSRLYVYPTMKLREYLKFSYTSLFNRVVYEPLRINNDLGVKYFTSDSALGTQRISAYAETFLFLKYKLFGFQLAPFVFGNASLLTGEHGPEVRRGFFPGVGGGIRTRNENLIFGTLELRFNYFPRKTDDANTFKVSFKSSIRFRYNTNYVKEPDIISLNTDDVNSFY